MICYTFTATIPLEEVQSSLLLALLSTESLHGEATTRLEAPHRIDSESRCVVIDDSKHPGRDLSRLFLGFISREFDADAFQVRRIAASSQDAPPPHRYPPAEWN